MEVRLLHCEVPPGPRTQVVRLFELAGPPEQATSIAQFLETWLPPKAVWQEAKDSGRFLIWSSDPVSDPCMASRRAGAICLTCPLTSSILEDGRSSWSLLLPAHAEGTQRSLRELMGPDQPDSLRGLRAYFDDWLLTPHQEKAVATALALGYFDFPRRAGLTEIAAALGVKRSTAQEHLRRGLAKILVQRGRVGLDRIAFA